MIKINNWIIVAFATSDTPYEFELSTKLLPSLEKLSLPHHIEIIENQGSWLKNVAMKPLVILRAMEKYPASNIISLDADSEVLQYPTLFNNIPEQYDIALHILDWDSWYGYTNHVKEILSGTVWIKNNDKMKNVVKLWYDKSIENCVWEQKILEAVLEEQKINIYPLPLEYCYILSLPDGKPPKIQLENPVIVHYQKSRIYKRKIR